MDKFEKILNIIGIIVISLFIIFIIWFAFQIKEMMNDYRCSQLPLQDFFNDPKCEPYWKYVHN